MHPENFFIIPSWLRIIYNFQIRFAIILHLKKINWSMIFQVNNRILNWLLFKKDKKLEQKTSMWIVSLTSKDCNWLSEWGTPSQFGSSISDILKCFHKVKLVNFKKKLKFRNQMLIVIFIWKPKGERTNQHYQQQEPKPKRKSRKGYQFPVIINHRKTSNSTIHKCLQCC